MSTTRADVDWASLRKELDKERSEFMKHASTDQHRKWGDALKKLKTYHEYQVVHQTQEIYAKTPKKNEDRQEITGRGKFLREEQRNLSSAFTTYARYKNNLPAPSPKAKKNVDTTAQQRVIESKEGNLSVVRKITAIKKLESEGGWDKKLLPPITQKTQQFNYDPSRERLEEWRTAVGAAKEYHDNKKELNQYSNILHPRQIEKRDKFFEEQGRDLLIAEGRMKQLEKEALQHPLSNSAEKYEGEQESKCCCSCFGFFAKKPAPLDEGFIDSSIANPAEIPSNEYMRLN